jgi:hypothetical protein
VYYAAPLTSLAKVVAQRDSSSLHWPLCCMNVINGTLWFAYGMVRGLLPLLICRVACALAAHAAVVLCSLT